MRFPPEASWGANAGLQKARDFLAPLAVKYKMSVADVWTLAGAVAVESMGGDSPRLTSDTYILRIYILPY